MCHCGYGYTCANCRSKSYSPSISRSYFDEVASQRDNYRKKFLVAQKEAELLLEQNKALLQDKKELTAINKALIKAIAELIIDELLGGINAR
jgi:uncharacterized membrane protein